MFFVHYKFAIKILFKEVKFQEKLVSLQHKNLLTYFFLLHTLNGKNLIVSSKKRIVASWMNNKFFNFFKTQYYSDHSYYLKFSEFQLLYQQNYLTHLLKIPVIIKNVNAKNLMSPRLLNFMIASVQAIHWRSYRIIRGNEVIEMLFMCIWVKNLTIFMHWVRSIFEQTRLKRHRGLVSLLQLLLEQVLWGYREYLNIKGLRFIVSGKFGKAGSVRKSRNYIQRGTVSYTTKNLALIRDVRVIRTFTGVFSITFEVFF